MFAPLDAGQLFWIGFMAFMAWAIVGPWGCPEAPKPVEKPINVRIIQ